MSKVLFLNGNEQSVEDIFYEKDSKQFTHQVKLAMKKKLNLYVCGICYAASGDYFR